MLCRVVAGVLLVAYVAASLLKVFATPPAADDAVAGDAWDSDPYYTAGVGKENPWGEDKNNWGMACRRVHRDVQERVGKFPKKRKILALCGVGYYWSCEGGVCGPWSDAKNKVREDDEPCGPLLRTDHVKDQPEEYPLSFVLLRHADSIAYLDASWEAMFNGAAFSHEFKIPQLIAIISRAAYGDLISFPRSIYFIKILAIHACFSLSTEVDRVLYIDNDAFFTEEAFILAASSGWRVNRKSIFTPYIPQEDTWDITLQDEMPFGEPIAGHMALRRTSGTSNLLAEWWHGASTINTSIYNSSWRDGCGWYHPYDQRMLIAAVLQRMSGYNNFTVNVSCTRYTPQGWLHKRDLGKGMPLEGWKNFNFSAPAMSVEWEWIVNGVRHSGKDWEFVRRLDSVTKVASWDRQGMTRVGYKLPFFSDVSWPGVHFVPWNSQPYKLAHSEFFNFISPNNSLIYHIGSVNVKCWRRHIPLGTNGTQPPQWASSLPDDPNHNQSRDVSSQRRCKRERLYRHAGVSRPPKK